MLLGLTVEQNVTLQPAGVTEQVNVTAESPIVDVKQSGRSTNIRS